MKTAFGLVLLVAALMFLPGIQSVASLRLISAKFVIAKNDAAVTRVVIGITSGNKQDSHEHDRMDLTITYQGTLRSKPDRILIKNSTATIAAINFVPATKAMVAYLIIQQPDGTAMVMPDIGPRIAALCASRKKAYCDGFTEVTKIRGPRISIFSEDYGASLYYIDVFVSQNGNMRLVRYEKDAWVNIPAAKLR